MDPTKCVMTVSRYEVALAECNDSFLQDWMIRDGKLQVTIEDGGTMCLVLVTRPGLVKCDDSTAQDGWIYRENRTLMNKGKCLANSNGTLVTAACTETDPPLAQQWYFAGSSAFAVSVAEDHKVSVTEISPSGQIMTTNEIGGSFKKALSVLTPDGLNVLGVDTSGEIKKNILNLETRKWSGWASLSSAPSGVQDISVSAAHGELYVAAIIDGNILWGTNPKGSGKTFKIKVSSPGEWKGVAGVLIPGFGDEVGDDSTPEMYQLFLYGGKSILNVKVGVEEGQEARIIDEHVVQQSEEIVGVTASLGGAPEVHLEYASKSHVYASTMSFVTGRIADRWEDLGEVQLTSLTSTEVPGLVAVCGTGPDLRSKCAQRRTFIGPPAKWTTFVSSDTDKKVMDSMSYYVSTGVRVLSRKKTVSGSLLL
ncbi:hypothetical protein [Streptomyces sp. NBC_01207]|uniref:hypothetical protein n=1 Tax=Streptomyces sp. NBC_01207 TaxID=2903772 RepID=UPI002E1172A6|nr:RICIN domain-containing protein [Streptomyces sp. NBC_01207]